MNRAQLQAERGKNSPAHFDRQFARRQWRKQLGDMFQFRGRLPSCPSFKEFCGKLSDPI